MTDYGAGNSGFGSGRAGYGSPYTINSTAVKLFLKEEDLTQQANAAAINPVTGDYVRDQVTGIHRGMDSVQQMVYLALRTAKNSTLIPNFGLRSFGDIVTDSVKLDITNAINEALQDLVLRQLVEVISIDINKLKATAFSILVKWRNLTNKETNTFRIQL